MANSPPLEPELLKSKFLGCMLGLAVGDALGAPFEGAWFPAPDQVKAVAAKSHLLRYTDDAHMAIGLAESLIACKDLNGWHLAEVFTKNFEQEPWRGYGPGPPRIFKKIRAGMSWDKAALDIYPGGSYGNGAAMRVAPVGLFYFKDFKKLVAAARDQSIITHAHLLGQEGAVLLALTVALVTGGSPAPASRDIIGQLRQYALEEVYLQKLKCMEALLETKDAGEIASQLGNGIEAFNSVPAAICCALRHPGSFEDAVLEAVSLGGDADTIACMAGAIAGARLGSEAIPGQWLKKLENKAYFEELAVKLLEAVI